MASATYHLLHHPSTSISIHLALGVCGAILSQAWLQIQWPPGWHSENIATKELVPIVAAAATWGSQWQFQAIRGHCDNIHVAVVSAINSGRAKFPPVNRLLHCLFFFFADQFNFGPTAEHIKGLQNQPEDANSCNYTISTHFQLNPSPQPMPKDLLQSLLDRQAHSLVIASLESTVQHLFSKGLATSTHRAYSSASRRYLRFCNTFCIPTPFPLSEDTLCYFVAHLSTQV